MAVVGRAALEVRFARDGIVCAQCCDPTSAPVTAAPDEERSDGHLAGSGVREGGGKGGDAHVQHEQRLEGEPVAFLSAQHPDLLALDPLIPAHPGFLLSLQVHGTGQVQQVQTLLQSQLSPHWQQLH